MLSETIYRIQRAITDQSLLTAAFYLFILYCIARLIISNFTVNARFWKAQPWIGVRNEWFPKARAKVRAISSLRQMLSDGYINFSKKNEAFVLPMLGEKPWMVLPPSSIPELLAKLDSELDGDILHEQQLQHKYTQGLLGRHTVDVPIQYEIIHRQLNKRLPHLIDAFNDELDQSFRQYWGTDTSFTEVKISETCEKIITRVANRIFAGPEICRDESFLKHSRLYSEGVGSSGIIIRMLPEFLKPLLAPIITYPNRKNYAACLKVCLPVIDERLKRTAAKRANAKFDWEPPFDLLQWIIEECFNRNDPKELNPLLITQRILMLNFVAIDTTHMSMTHTILDLYASPDSDEFVAGLREECGRVLRANNGHWTKSGLNDLVRIDSTIRESMRYSDIGYIALTRMVVDPHGTQFNVNGLNEKGRLMIPPGIRVGVAACAIHADPMLYPSPRKFQAFRFVKNPENEAIETRNYEPKTSIVTTTDRFLPFGHGRHACPGRFFAAQEMKLMLAYLVQNYDLEKIAIKAEGTVTVGTARPDVNLKIKVRRRKEKA